MARKDSENQKKSMSLLFRGKAIFKQPAVSREGDFQTAEHRLDRRAYSLRTGVGRKHLFLHEKRHDDHDRRRI